MNALARLRAFAAPGRTEDPCGLCGAPIEDRHAHVVEASSGGILCVCRGCAGVFDHASGKFRRIPDRVVRVSGLEMSDPDWAALEIPIGLAFFRNRPSLGRVQAFYPSPLGAVESSVPAEAWSALLAAHPEVASMEPEVEALLVRRKEGYIVPLDEAHALIGLIRRNWRGFSGGDEVGPAIVKFFTELRERSGGRP
ncbi:MAG: hypothetical protein HY293_01755 [Planctomycetes bacterium]|nr:hypothetical protein [Planctomycetota bacterium]